ncbi:MAG: ChbG/HpnK family deacetylase [Candidatus Pacebacteria bacterium]|nr:ChbG/HpnK family deacetylase [Candidatus Paceibacterota bacterium]
MHRTVFVTADDFGLTKCATDSILDAVDHGLVNQVSVIANGYAADYALSEWLTRRERLALSLHLNLTEGKVMSPPGLLRIIAHADGTFRYSALGLLLRSYLPWKNRAFREELLIESMAQLAFVRERVGSVPVSIDGHQHIQMIPAVMRVIETLHARNPFSRVRIPREPFFIPESGLLAYVGMRGVRHVGLNMLSLLSPRRLPTTGYFLGSLLSGEQTLASVSRALARSHSPRVLSLEIGLHPGVAHEEEVAQWEGDRAWHTSRWRSRELLLAKDPGFARLVSTFADGTFSSSVRGLGSVMKFLIAGTIATGTNLGLLYVLTDVAGLWYLASMVIAYTLATVVGFILQKFWAFSHHSLERTRSEIAVFVANNALGVAFDAVGLYVLVEYAGLWYMTAQFLLLALIALWNFFVYRFLFSERTTV